MEVAVVHWNFVSSSWFADAVLVLVGFVGMPLLVCLLMRFQLWTWPWNLFGFSRWYVGLKPMTIGFGVFALLGPPFFLVVISTCWLLDRLQLTHNNTDLVTVICGPLWIAMMSGVPYLYLRRRLRRGQADGTLCPNCGIRLPKRSERCSVCAMPAPFAETK